MKDPNAVALGRKGGSVSSSAKQAAVVENLKKARQKRWPNHGIGQLTPEQVEKAVYPSREALRAICAGGKSAIQPVGAEVFVDQPVMIELEGSYDRIPCKHKEWLDGEQYSCSLEAGHKGKCIRGNRIEV